MTIYRSLLLALALLAAAGCRSAGTVRITVAGGGVVTIIIRQAAQQAAGKTVEVPIDATVPLTP